MKPNSIAIDILESNNLAPMTSQAKSVVITYGSSAVGFSLYCKKADCYFMARHFDAAVSKYPTITGVRITNMLTDSPAPTQIVRY